MKIAIDAMGSDGAPRPEIEGALLATADSPDLEVILVGDESKLKAELARRGNPERISILHASERVTMHDSPVMAVRKKKDASLLVALRLAKRGEVAGVVSAGNTGAVMVASRTILGPIRGVARSAICQRLPSARKPVLLLDLGANVDCTARHLCDFAEMGSVYAREALGIENPRVGLLNIGEEQLKGNELAKTVHRNLSAEEHINFIGNVEPKAMFAGGADVVVCDGFVGNIVLKTSEAVGGLLAKLLVRELTSSWISKLGAFLSRGAYARLRKTVDANDYSGAPLLGVNGVVIIIHGSCEARGVANAIAGARQAHVTRINEHIRRGIEELRNTEAHLVEKEKEG